MTDEPIKAGWCQHCREECRDRLGVDVYPGEPDRAEDVIWECVFCGARVGSDAKGQPLGTAANEELRKARTLLSARLEPIWQLASSHPDYATARYNANQGERMKALAIIKRTAKKRTHDFLAEAMGLESFNVEMLDIEQCREAWRAMIGKTYSDIRDWAHARKATAAALPASPSEGPAQE